MELYGYIKIWHTCSPEVYMPLICDTSHSDHNDHQLRYPPTCSCSACALSPRLIPPGRKDDDLVRIFCSMHKEKPEDSSKNYGPDYQCRRQSYIQL
jgi:hypothetical protein